MKAMKKPVEIECWRFDGYLSTAATIIANGAPALFVPTGYEHHLRRDNEFDAGGNGHIRDDAPAYLAIHTLEGWMRADIGWVIIKGVQGEFYPCKPEIFEETYDITEAD